MILCKRWAAVAFMGATALAGAAPAQTLVQTAAKPVAATAIRREISVRTAPVNAVPDAGETFDADAGLEAREAMGEPVGPPAPEAADTLNAQYARLRASAAPALPTLETEPAAAPAGPSVALARRVVESAQAFAGYMQRASAVRADYVDAAGVSRALRAGGVYEAGQMQEGAVAYVALAALQDPAFVQAIGELGRDPQRRSELALSLQADPRGVLHAPGASAAAIGAAGALGRLAGSLYGAGAAVKQSAYDIQHSAWSVAPVSAPEAALVEIKARSSVREALSADAGGAMLTSLVQLRGAAGGGGSGRMTPVVVRGLTLAALAVLGEAGEDQAERVGALLTETSSAQCLKMARLNLYQCLSVAGPNYEDVFCLGQHAMMETARCVADASGWTPAADPASQDLTPVVRTSIMVPVAFTPQASSPAVEPENVPALPLAPAALTPTLQMASAGMG